MKKNLAVRIGAIAMVLMVAFFSILPDLVSAEGDDTDILAESEIVAEAPEEDVPEISEEEETTDLPVEETTEEGIDEGNGQEGETTEPEITEPEPPVEGNDSEGNLSGDGNDTDSNKETDDSEDSGEENSNSQEPNEEEDLTNPGDEDQTQPEEGTIADEESGEKDTIDDYLAMLDNTQMKRIKGAAERFDSADKMADMELFVTEEEDFLIEGTTLVKYLGSAPYVEIPPYITVIGDSAFAGNTTLLGVILPANLQAIGSSAFNGCCNLGEISIPGSVTSVGDSAFANCTGLAGVSIGAGTGTVSANEFYNCVSLQSVTVPEGISSVRSGAFANCSNLSSISLPSTLASLDRGAFAGDTNLASISIADGAYSSYDGCVYTGDGSQLLLCPQGKTGISIAPGTASIASGAFNGCNYLLSAVVPDATNSVESNAFSGSAIKSVTIPSGVTSIGSQSGWTPNVVYGYSGTTAEAWANQNNYVFESLNGTSGGGNTGIQDEHIEDPDDAEDPTEETESGKRSGTTTKASAGTGGTGTTAAISRNAGNRTNATPKTGVEDYGIYFLFAGVFLMGIAFFAYSKKLRLDR